jgi:3' exoribonuclease, RNase T-like
MRYWFDTEFIDDGRTIDLISIGIVAEDGREYYAESADCDYAAASDWVTEHVLPHLTGERKPRNQIADEIKEFVGVKPEFWAYYAAYDWVVLCQLYGTMMQLPQTWPMWCRDLKQYVWSLGDTFLQSSRQHNALDDARWAKEAWSRLHG